MAEPKCNGDEHPPDAVQTQLITITDTGGITTADFEGNALYGLLKVNDVAISTPMQKSMELLTRPWKESLDVSFEFFGSPDDFGSTHLKLSARGFEGFGDEQVGSITIWSKHMTENKVEEEKQTNKLLVKGQDGLRMHAQLQSLRKTMDIDSEQHGGLYFPSRILEDINATSTIIRGRAQLDAKLDPLARFFTHAPVAKTLTMGQLPAPGEDGFPDTEVAARVLHFATDSQYLLYNVAGAYYDEHLQWQALQELAIQKRQGQCRQMSQDELNEVVPNSTESNQPDRAKWLERVVGWAFEHEDLFVKAYELAKAEPSDGT
ncbi:uncharacterized protein NECHADRAFT_79053 [Fusarium vanettenii 77-13-4]|uniref:Uncharacterized protein n=1 Tax=Fusarium vanettenii (strain ATCC MYA-4622 / CBS 123669 / FGSC 9596 / NRRL 45880 / 77-13-4) TaxID=660122 RepID=C7YQC1_FUSV7|nr:uncharacterized protein NECHADRAFT_79053 [Fusarium vanettenii 77-13-4]EEU45998.1 predicted protein [Fusarium vanettenii 77-13-4]